MLSYFTATQPSTHTGLGYVIVLEKLHLTRMHWNTEAGEEKNIILVWTEGLKKEKDMRLQI